MLSGRTARVTWIDSEKTHLEVRTLSLWWAHLAPLLEPPIAPLASPWLLAKSALGKIQKDNDLISSAAGLSVD